MRPRHDFFQYAFQIGKGLVELDYRVYDEVELDFTFKDSSGKESTVPDCVWAVVAKDEIKSIRKRRWDLVHTSHRASVAVCWANVHVCRPSLRQPTSLASHPRSRSCPVCDCRVHRPRALLILPIEFADITANLLKPLGPLNLPAVLSDPTILPYFRCLSLTDQPRTRPSIPVPPADRRRHLTLTLALPPASEAGATLPLLVAAFQLVDAIAGTGKAGLRGGLNGQLRPETRVKLRKIREEVDKEIREDAVKEKREEQAEEKAAAKRKAEEERLSRLSAADQKKVSSVLCEQDVCSHQHPQAMDREKKRAMRKSQGRVKVR